MGKRSRKSEELLEEEKPKTKIPKKHIIIEIILLVFLLLFIGGSIFLAFDILHKKEAYDKSIKGYEEKVRYAIFLSEFPSNIEASNS